MRPLDATATAQRQTTDPPPATAFDTGGGKRSRSGDLPSYESVARTLAPPAGWETWSEFFKKDRPACRPTAVDLDDDAHIDADLRSVSVRGKLKAKWYGEIRRRSLSERKAWLATAEAHVAFGAKNCHVMLKAIDTRTTALTKLVPSSAWLAGWTLEGDDLPNADPDRQHGVQMQLSRAAVSFGQFGVRHQRLTPPQAVRVEDFLDLMNDRLANSYEFPSSPSGAVIGLWRERNERPKNKAVQANQGTPPLHKKKVRKRRSVNDLIPI